jgi:hypothetical protein
MTKTKCPAKKLYKAWGTRFYLPCRRFEGHEGRHRGSLSESCTSYWGKAKSKFSEGTKKL